MDMLFSSRELLSLTDTSTTTSEFVQNLYISIPIGVVLIIIYCIARAYDVNKYEVRRKFAQVMVLDEDSTDVDLSTQRRGDAAQSQYTMGHPDISDGFVLWMYQVWTMDTATFFKFAGLDALVFRLYVKGCVYMCLAALPYALIVLLPVYATGKEESNDSLKMFTIENCSAGSKRLWATVVGAYLFIIIVLYYLSKIYLAVAYAADQNFVGNVGNAASLKQIDSMSWFNYRDAVINVIQFNVNVVSTGLAKVKGTIDTIVEVTGIDRKSSNDDGTGTAISGVAHSGASGETTGLLKAGTYGATDDSTDDSKMLEDGRSASEEVIIGATMVSIDKYTVMIRDLPEQFRNKQRFETFMNRLFPNQIHKIFMLYDVHDLSGIYDEIQKHEHALRKLRRKHGDALVNDDAIMVGNCCGCCGAQKDVNKYHKEELISLKRSFMNAREFLTPSPTAFVTFKDLQTAAVCALCPVRFGLYPLKIHHAPHPRDLRWSHLKFSSIELLSNNAAGMGLFLLLLVFWSIPVTAIQALANLETIFSYAGIILSKYLSSSTISWLESWVSVLVLDLFLKILPTACEKLTELQRKPSRGKEEILTMTKYFDCLVVMVLLITVLAGTALSSLDSLFNSLTDVFSTLATGLTSISTYFLLYILLNAFIWLPLELFRPGYFIKIFLHLEEPNRFSYSRWYAKTMLILLICITYGVMCPLVWILGLFYFFFCTIVFSYQLSMAYIPEFETGAAVWPAVFSRLTITFNLGIATLVGLLILKEAYVQAACTLPLFLYNSVSARLNLQFRKVFRAASLTSASQKDKLLAANKNNLESNWNAKSDMAYYPPIMDIDYSNVKNNDGSIPVAINSGSSIQAASYQSDNLA